MRGLILMLSLLASGEERDAGKAKESTTSKAGKPVKPPLPKADTRTKTEKKADPDIPAWKADTKAADPDIPTRPAKPDEKGK